MNKKKLSKRDKNLIILLIVALLGFVFYKFVYTPQKEKIDALTTECNTKLAQKAEYERKIGQKGEIDIEIDQAKDAILPIAKRYYADVNQEEFIVLINDLSKQSNLDIKGINFQESKDLDLETELELDKPEENKPPENPPADGQNPPADGDNPPADGQNPPADGQNPPAKPAPNVEPIPYEDNIKLTQVDMTFDGTYAEVVKLLQLLDEKEQNVISNNFAITKNTSGSEASDPKYANKNKNDFIDGTMTIKFYKVISLEKYKKTEPSILANQIEPKTKHTSPILGYPWGDDYELPESAKLPVATTNSSLLVEPIPMPNAEVPSLNFFVPKSNTAKPAIVKPLLGNKPSSKPSSKPAIAKPSNNSVPKATKEDIAPKPRENFSKPIELTKFDSLQNANLVVSSRGDIGSMSLDTAPSLAYKAINLKYQFKIASKSNNDIIVDIIPRDIMLKSVPNKIVLNIYSEAATGHNVGIIFVDEENKEHKVPLNETLDFVGWKELSIDKMPEMKYPVKVKGVYINRTEKQEQVKGNVYLDKLSAVYVSK